MNSQFPRTGCLSVTFIHCIVTASQIVLLPPNVSFSSHLRIQLQSTSFLHHAITGAAIQSTHNSFSSRNDVEVGFCVKSVDYV